MSILGIISAERRSGSLMDHIKIGKFIADCRKKKNLTQIQVQMKTGIDQSDYSKLERGSRYPTVEQAKRLALLYNTSLDSFIIIGSHP